MPKRPWDLFVIAVESVGALWLISIGFILIAHTLAYVVPYFLRDMVDVALVSDELLADLLPIFYAIIAIFAVREICTRIPHIMHVKVEEVVQRNTFNRLHTQIIHRPSQYFEDQFAGDIARKINIITTNTVFFFNDFPWRSTTPITSTLVFLWLLSTTHELLVGIFILWILSFVLTSIPLLHWLYRVNLRVAETDSALGGQSVDLLSNIAITHSFAHESFELDRLTESSEAYIEAYKKESWCFIWNKFQQGMHIVLLVVSLVGATVYLLQKGMIQASDIVIIATIIPVISNIVWSAGDMVNEAIRKFSQIRASLTELQTEQERLPEQPGVIKNPASAITLRNVAFRYPGTPNDVFSGLSLEIPVGQKLGVVGSSGSGKSTLIKLLLRQYDVDSGVIHLGEQNIADVTLASLRNVISFVPQDTTLFHRSLFENIRYAEPDATLQEIIAVSKKAHTHDFIEALPEQYDTKVGERGVKLSGGQRQRIAIARAMLKDAPILVLDEATSALDGESEAIVQEGFKNLFAGRTVIAVAHRLSTLREMDRIVVIEDGEIVEDGTPADLLKIENGVFKQKWEQQKDGFVS